VKKFKMNFYVRKGYKLLLSYLAFPVPLDKGNADLGNGTGEQPERPALAQRNKVHQKFLV